VILFGGTGTPQFRNETCGLRRNDLGATVTEPAGGARMRGRQQLHGLARR